MISFFSEFMIQTRVKLFRRILDTAIQCDVLFIFPREVRYCRAVSVSFYGTGQQGSEANSESTHFPGIFSHHSPRKYNYKRPIEMPVTTCWCRIFQLILKYYLFFFLLVRFCFMGQNSSDMERLQKK